MPINFFNSEKILRLTPIAKETKEIADKILSGNVRIFPKLDNVKVNDTSELWEMNFDSSPSTYALYLYALYPVSYLLNAYEDEGNNRYINEALALALNFIEWESKSDKKINKKRSEILLGDHAVSNRTQVLCYLACCLRTEGRQIPQEITSALLKNGEYLADIKNYSHYNHGLMMDLALLALLNTLEGLSINYPATLKERLIVRLQHSIVRDITEDGVHIENSPGYHFWILGFLGKITKPLESLNVSIYLKAKDALTKASEYAKYIVRQDGSIPAIGDTHADIKYTPSKGLESKFFNHANQVIFRNQDDDLWAHFSSGYRTHVHKHCDNGAINIYYKGRDIFLDSGFLNYENNEESQIIRSTRSHNTVAPRGGSEQVIIKKNISGENGAKSHSDTLSESKIIEFFKSDSHEYSIAKIADYIEGSIFRLVLWVKGCGFFIYDRSSLNNRDGLEQFFNIPHDYFIEFQSGKILIKSLDDDCYEIIAPPINKNESHEIVVEKNFSAKGFGNKINGSRLVIRSFQDRCLTQVVLSNRTQTMINGENISFLYDGEWEHFNAAQVIERIMQQEEAQKITIG